jgi:hypothetical protein
MTKLIAAIDPIHAFAFIPRGDLYSRAPRLSGGFAVDRFMQKSQPCTVFGRILALRRLRRPRNRGIERVSECSKTEAAIHFSSHAQPLSSRRSKNARARVCRRLAPRRPPRRRALISDGKVAKGNTHSLR